MLSRSIGSINYRATLNRYRPLWAQSVLAIRVIIVLDHLMNPMLKEPLRPAWGQSLKLVDLWAPTPWSWR